MPAYYLGRGGGINLYRENVHPNPVWHSEREFVHYDMLFPVTFPAKKKSVLNNLFSVGYNF